MKYKHVDLLLFPHAAGSNYCVMTVTAHSCQSSVNFGVKKTNLSMNFCVRQLVSFRPSNPGQNTEKGKSLSR